MALPGLRPWEFERALDHRADLLLINGDPLEDISILTKPEENLALIMKRREDI